MSKLSVKQLQDKKVRLETSLATAETKVTSIQDDIQEVQSLLVGKTAELQAQIDAINGTDTTQKNNTEAEVI